MRLSMYALWQVDGMHYRQIQSLSLTNLNNNDAMLKFLYNISEDADHGQITGPPCNSQCCHMPIELVLC